MSIPQNPPGTMSKELRAWSRQLEAYKASNHEQQELTELLLKRVGDLDVALQNAKNDLDDQIGVRRQWRKRAEDVESRIARNQFAVVLIDGNQFIFRPELLRAGASGAAEAAPAFLAEIRAFVKAQHISDLPEGFQVIVNIFADFKRLERAFRESDTLTESAQFAQFHRGLTHAQPLMSFIDCGPEKNAVETKLQHFYELYVENCHCRHIVLALDHESQYLPVLDSYAEDELTLSKTSLVKSLHGFPSKYNLPFTVADFATLDTIPLISLDATATDDVGVPEDGNTESSVSDLHILQNDVCVKTLQKSPIDGDNMQGKFYDRDSSKQSSASARKDSSTTSSVPKAASSISSGSASGPIPRSSKFGKGITARHVVIDEGHKAPTAAAAPVRTVDAPLDSYRSTVSSYMQDWETAPSKDIYTVPADLTPWGATNDTPSWADAMNENTRPSNVWAANDSTSQNSRNPEPFEREGFPERKKSSYLENRKNYQQPRGSGRGYQSRNPPLAERQQQAWTGVQPFRPHQATYANNGLAASRFAQTDRDSVGATAPVRSDIGLNASGQRIDLRLPPLSATEQARFDSRTRSQKLCNEHHLRNACRNSRCHFDHDPIDDGLLLALRHVARKAACSIGPACRRSDCFCGHLCSYSKSGSCKNPKCAFASRGMHGIEDTEIVETISA